MPKEHRTFLDPVVTLAHVIGRIRQIAEANGRDSETLRTVVRVNRTVTSDAAPGDAVPHRGTVAQVADYLLAAHAAGADEVLVDLQLTARNAEELTDLADRFHDRLSEG
ncbi:hypothetical protein [Streptomyces sp. NPDC088707]|uniref:hypothetical protein n=1 Tax=Streptomyces sp. NPDC088707 TaxID=3365871 RepID=UPI0038118F78